jgi:hypothetical protein
MPEVERKTIETEYGDKEVFKYRCPNCDQKELPWLGQWNGCGAMEEWNRIAPKCSYHKRTLEYNIHGVCVAEPFRVFEWRDRKKAYHHVTLSFYLDNSMYSYCYDYWRENGGGSKGLWIGDLFFPSMTAAKKHVTQELIKRMNIAGIVKELLLDPVQGELF